MATDLMSRMVVGLQAARAAMSECLACLEPECKQIQDDMILTACARIDALLAEHAAQCEVEISRRVHEGQMMDLTTGRAPQPASEVKACVTGQCPDKQSCNEAQCCLYTAAKENY